MENKQIKIKAIITGAGGETTDISDFIGDVKVSGAFKESARTLDFKILKADVDKTLPSIDIDLGSAVSFYEKPNNQGYLHKDAQKSGIDEILSRYVK